MGKNQSASNLTNIIQQDANGGIAFMSGSTMLMALSNTGQMSGSVPVLAAATASFVQNAQSASYVLTAQTASFVANAQSASNAVAAATASFVALAQSASNAVAAATASFVALAQSASNAVAAATASFVALAQSASNAVSAQTASFANTFTVNSTLTAQTLVVQTITSSVDFVTGSTRFGSILGNTHVFTGSLSVTGSTTLTGVLNGTSAGFTGVLQVKSTSSTPSIWSGQFGGAISILGDNSTSNRYIDLSIVDSTGALATQGLRIVNSGRVGINKLSPAAQLDVEGEGRFTDMQVTGSAGSKVSIYNNYSGGNPGIALFNTAGTEVIWINAANASINAALGTFTGKVSVNSPISPYANGITVGGTGAGFMMYSSATGNQSSIQIFNGSLYGYGVIGIVSGTGASTGDVYALGWNSSANAAFTPILNWGSTGNVGIGTSPSSYKLEVNGAIRSNGNSIADAYSGQYTTDSAWTSLQTVIPGNTLNAYETYLVEIRWEYNGATYAPYYADASFLFKPVPTNSSGTGNVIDLQTSCHVSGNYIISVAQQNASNASCGGLALKLNWTPSSPSYVLVKAKRIAI